MKNIQRRSMYGYLFIIMIINLIIQNSVCSQSIRGQRQLLDDNRQQKHFMTIQSKTLYLSKSLLSKQQLILPLQRLFSISTTLQQSYSSNNIIHFSPTTVKLSSQKHSNFLQFNLQLNQSQTHKSTTLFGHNQTQTHKSTTLFGRQILAQSKTISKFINQSILNDLRTPFPIQISQIVVLNQSFIFLFVFPSKVIILEEMTNLINIKNTYQVQQFKSSYLNKHKSSNNHQQSNTNQNQQSKTESNQQSKTESNQSQQQLTPQTISFYPLGDSYVIAYLQSLNHLFLFDSKGYIKLNNIANITNLQHIHSFNSTTLQFFTAQRQSGFKHCQINLINKNIQIINNYQSLQSIGFNTNISNLPNINSLQVYDISFNSNSNQIYLLDINLGVIKFNYQLHNINQKSLNQYIIVPNTTSLLIKQRGCQALDYIHNDRLIIICQDRKRKFFIQAYFDSITNSFIKQPPVFHNCNFQDLQITSDFYIAFQTSSIDIFWPSKHNFIPELVHNKKHINLLGIQAFKITIDKKGDVYLYSVRNNILIKQKLEEQKYSLSIGSSLPITKSFSIQVFGSCQVLYFNLNQKNKKYSMYFPQNQIDKINSLMTTKQISKNHESSQLCRIKVPIQLQTSRYIFENRGKFSLAVGILVICILIAFTLICICVKKYTGMQKTAQQTLQKLKKGQKINPQFIL